MVKLLIHAGRCSGRYFALAALTTTLVACGGGSGDDETLDGGTEIDGDGDGFVFGEGPDADEDGILDSEDNNIDLDRDGFDDVIGNEDLDGDGELNKDDLDADGDGLLDSGLDDKFVDLDGDGLDDESGLTEGAANFEDITPATPCGSESGQDAYSSNANWNDNCLIKRSSVDGQFADSLYAVGVQRIVFCLGFGGESTQDYTTFADGEYGPASERALKAFQASTPNPLPDDGQVGSNTWAKLEASIVLLEAGEIGADADGNATVAPDSYGFNEGDCADIPMFYQTATFDSETQMRTAVGWRLVKNTPSLDSVPFSIDAPFNRL